MPGESASRQVWFCWLQAEKNKNGDALYALFS